MRRARLIQSKQHRLVAFESLCAALNHSVSRRKLQGSLFGSEGEANKRDLEKLRTELRAARNQLSPFQNSEHAPLATTVGELQSEVADLREQLAASPVTHSEPAVSTATSRHRLLAD